MLFAILALFGFMQPFVNTTALIMYILATLPCLCAGYLCCKWMGGDNKETRSGLSCAFFIEAICALIYCGNTFFAYMKYGGDVYQPTSAAVGAALYTYWYSIAKTYEVSAGAI